MNIVGQATLKLTDIRTNTTRKIFKTNVITDLVYKAFTYANDDLNYNSGTRDNVSVLARNIGISKSTKLEDATDFVVPNIIAVGELISRKWIDYPDYESGYIEYHARILNVIQPRDFQTVVLTSHDPQNSLSTNLTDSTASAYLRLEAPVTQGAFEILEIYYEIIGLTPTSTSKLLNHPGMLTYYLQSTSRASNTRGAPSKTFAYVYSSFAKAPVDNYQFNYLSNGNLLFEPFSYYGGRQWIYTVTPEYFKVRMTHDFTLDECVGKVLNSITLGSYNIPANPSIGKWATDSPVYVQPATPDSYSPRQTMWGHSVDATHPFFDPSTAQGGSGKIIFNDNWTQVFPEIYRVDIKSSGDVGAATYTWKRRRFLAFNGKSWEDVGTGNMWRNLGSPSWKHCHGYGVKSVEPIKIDERTIAQMDETGVSIYDIYDGTNRNWDVDSNPSLIESNLPITRGKYMTYSNGVLYVGCRETGVWKIDPNASSYQVTNLTSAPCYGLGKANNVIYAFTEGGIKSSKNWNINLPFSYPLIEGNWSRVSYIAVDEFATDGKMAIVYKTSVNGTYYLEHFANIAWWSETVTTVITDNIYKKPIYAASFDLFGGQPGYYTDTVEATFELPGLIKGRNGIWAAGLGQNTDKLTFNSPLSFNLSNVTGFGGFYYCNLMWVDDTSLQIIFGSFNGRAIVNLANNTLVKPLVVTGYNEPNIVYWGRGIMYRANTWCLIDTAWEEYGWDGASWALNSNGVKTTHFDSQPLIDNLTIKFEAGASTDFITGNFYTQPFCHGLLKDNGNLPSLSVNLYTKSTVANYELPIGTLSLTVPNTAPHALYFPAKSSDPQFNNVEAADKTLYEIKLNGVKIDESLILLYASNYGLNNIPLPPPGGVSIDYASAIMAFHPNDAGKSITGYYTYQHKI